MKKRIFIGLLACLLVLPQGALAAGVMNTGERVETPLGEETPAFAPGAAATPETGVSAPARLSDDGHTAADHASWTALSAAGTLAAGSYYLSGDVTGNLVIDAGATVDLCLNGHTLDANSAGSVITVNAGATLNLYDCPGTGRITGGQASVGGGVNVNGGTLNLYGGSITGNIATTATAGPTPSQGGGVYVGTGGVFQMLGGTVSDNRVVGKGAGNQQSYGGGVYVAGTFRMSGGSITGNTGKGGGVYLPADGVLELSGSPVVTGNSMTNGSGANVTLVLDQKITITGALDASASIGVTMNTPGVFTAGSAVVNADYAANFFSDTANRSACAVGDQLSLGAQITYAKPDGIAGDVPVDTTVYAVGDTASVDTTLPLTKRTCRQIGWTDIPDGTEPITSLVVARNTTLYPVFDRFFVTYAVPAGVSGTAPVDATEYTAEETATLDTTCPLTRQGYRQIGWTDSTSAAVAKSTITITGDVTVYPVFARTFTAAEDTIRLTYGAPMETIDLADLLQFADGVTNTDKNFVFSMADGQSFPAGISFAGRGRVGGTPTAAPGTYSVTLNVRDTSYATLFALDPSTASRTATLTLTFEIAKGAPAAGDFTFTPPADLAYDGTRKTATVSARAGVEGMGAVTVKYSPASPMAPGTYTVSIDVAEGANYRAATNLTDPDWTFTIAEREARSVTLGAPQWSSGRTTIALTPTPANLLNGAQIVAGRYEDGAMTDLAWGVLNGNTVTFQGKRISANSGWKIFFLGGGSAPLCPAGEV